MLLHCSCDVYVGSFMKGLMPCHTAASHMCTAGAFSSWTIVVKIWALILCQDSIVPDRLIQHATRKWHLGLPVWYVHLIGSSLLDQQFILQKDIFWLLPKTCLQSGILQKSYAAIGHLLGLQFCKKSWESAPVLLHTNRHVSTLKEVTVICHKPAHWTT